MASHIKSMTEGKPGKLILTFALPLMAGNVFQQLYTVVDTAVVGKFLGVGALAALGASDWLNWMILGIIQGFTQGFAILMAQEFGAENFHRLRKVICSSGILSAVFALLLVAAGQLIARPVLLLLQTPADILGDTLLYLRIMFWASPSSWHTIFSPVSCALWETGRRLFMLWWWLPLPTSFWICFLLWFSTGALPEPP